MAGKSVRNRSGEGIPRVTTADLLLGGRDFLDPFAVGSWDPPVDICQTENRVRVQIELPGVEPSDISLTFQGDALRVQGIKREQARSRKLLCFYCLERRYGRFDRQVSIKGILNPRKSRASLEKGILTVEIPTVKERRGELVEIRIEKK